MYINKYVMLGGGRGDVELEVTGSACSLCHMFAERYLVCHSWVRSSAVLGTIFNAERKGGLLEGSCRCIYTLSVHDTPPRRFCAPTPPRAPPGPRPPVATPVYFFPGRGAGVQLSGEDERPRTW